MTINKFYVNILVDMCQLTELSVWLIMEERVNFMEHLNNIGEAVVNIITASENADGAGIAKGVINIVTNAGGIIEDIVHMFVG